MYCDYFGFDSDPFSIAPDPAFLYPSPAHRQALAHLKYGIEREGGFILLTGEVGTGKTTLCRLLIEQLPANTRIAYILHTQLDALDVLASICEELGVEVPGDGVKVKTYIDALSRDLLSAHADGRKTVVIVEEAQNLSTEVLEMLRLLTNLETNTCKLLHILLVGQPELLELISRPELRQLNQRVVSRFHLESLDRGETARYVNYRLGKAGSKRPLFSASALRELHKRSGGIPRLVNLIAERSLLGAYAEEQNQVGKSLVQRATREVLGASARAQRPSLRAAWFALVLLLLAGLGGVVWQDRSQLVEVATRAEEQPVGLPAEDTGQGGAEESLGASLLGLWQVDIAAGAGVADLCAAALRFQLRCVEGSDLQLTDLQAVNRPGLVTLTEDADTLRRYLLQSVRDNRMLLQGRQGAMEVSVDEFESRWQGDLHYLWRAPAGYQRDLNQGDVNWPLVNWLQDQLARISPDAEVIISAGNYSAPVVEQVKQLQREQGLEPDGILGERTIRKLNELNAEVPLLFSTASETD